jgi:hypothetical protein
MFGVFRMLCVPDLNLEAQLIESSNPIIYD